MNRIRLLVIGTLMMFALAAGAQQSATPSSHRDEQSQSAAQTTPMEAEQHLKMLTTRLDLTVDQQARVKPRIEEMLDTRQKLLEDGSISSEERHARLKALHEKADTDLREILNDDQKKKLDQLEQEHHPVMHGSTGGAAAQP